MRKLVIVPMCLLLCAGLAAAQSREERDVRAVLDRAFQASNSLDAKLTQQVLADYARGAGPFFPPFDAAWVSVAEVEKFYAQLRDQLTSRSYKPTASPTVRADKNLAMAHYPWRAEFVFKDGSRLALDGRATTVLVREGKAWKIAHWHSSLPTTAPLTRAAQAAEMERVLGVERAAVEALKNKQPEKLGDYFAESFSMFQPDQAYRTRGTRAENVRNAQSWLENTTLRSYQMLEPSVELFGDTAVLTYYFSMTTVSGGKETSDTGKATIVFRKENGHWRAVHEHISTNR